jgi:hypothetical protein
MEKLYRIKIVKFEFISHKCLLPIILKWEIDLQAKYEYQIINKIINELQNSLGVSDVRVVHNKVDTFESIQKDFTSVFENINFNSEDSSIKNLSVNLKRFLDLDEKDFTNDIVEKFKLFKMAFPVRIIDHTKGIINNNFELPIIVIEE